jgi:hypothetical protein
MLQIFYLNVAKLDRDVAYICKCFRCFHTYVASVSSCCLHMFVMATHLFSSFFSGVLQVFQTYVARVSALSDICCKRFIWMLQK